MFLSESSTFFESMFKNEMKEKYMNEISLELIDGDTLKHLVEYCYTGRIVLNNENCYKVMAAASMYQFTSLKNDVASYYQESLCAQNCLSMWGAARPHAYKELDQLAFDFAREHFMDIIIVDEFLELGIELLLELLKDAELEVNSEEDVFHAIEKWIKFDVMGRKEFLESFIETIRMSQISYQVKFNWHSFQSSSEKIGFFSNIDPHYFFKNIIVFASNDPDNL